MRPKPVGGFDEPELSSPRIRKPQRLAASPYGVVSTQHFAATEAGVRLLAQGGNAIDAAVAAAWALGVCEPAASGLGGQTFLIIRTAKPRRTVTLDGSSFAPHRAIPGTSTAADRRRGYRAATVPSTPRTLDYARGQFGTLSNSDVLQPAIELAQHGFEVTELFHRLTRRARHALNQGTAGTFFLKPDGRSYRPGERLKQPVLARTLQRLSEHGVDDFYTGDIACAIERDMMTHDGLIRLDDLAQVQPPIVRKPVSCWFGNLRVRTMPPPGAGRTLVEMLNILSCLPRKYRRLDSPESALMLARVMQQAYRDRHDRPFDPEYYAQVSDRKMLSEDYARSMAQRIRSRGETTHVSVMDRFGNVVGLTQSIERVYGSCCASSELGFLYNNYMMAFEHEDIGHPYYLRPAAAPWASVAPTIVFRDQQPWLVIGSPGSERITAAILQVLLRLQSQSPLEAVDAPRLYCNYAGRVSLEASRMRDDIPPLLRQHGFEVDMRDPYSFYMGCVQLVLRDGSEYLGVADPRRDGAAGGPIL
jgi:gamma-glutamyltranspeptidase/glutathione hydrolase